MKQRSLFFTQALYFVEHSLTEYAKREALRDRKIYCNCNTDLPPPSNDVQAKNIKRTPGSHGRKAYQTVWYILPQNKTFLSGKSLLSDSVIEIRQRNRYNHTQPGARDDSINKVKLTASNFNKKEISRIHHKYNCSF